MRLYICYAHEDLEDARAIYNALRKEGITVSLEKERNTLSPSELQRLIDREIPTSDAVVLLWSHNAAVSPWVMRELATALTNNKKVISCLVDEEPVTKFVDQNQTVKWDNSDSAIQELKSALGIESVESEGSLSTPTLNEALIAYRQAIGHHYGSIRALGQGANFPIDKVYLPLSVNIVRSGKEDFSSKPIQAEDLLNIPSHRIVVLGLPGTGKSTLAKYLTYRGSIKTSAYFPVFVRIADLMSTSDTILDFITQHINDLVKRRLGEAITSSDDYCRAGTVLFLDGFDEISDVDRQDFKIRLETFRNAHSAARIIITSRDTGFDAKMFEGYTNYRIKNLSTVDIERYIWAVCSAEYREKVWNTIKNDSRLFQLAQTPFLLAMICVSPDALGTRATQRALLLESCTQYLLKKRDWQEEGTGRPRETDETASILENALKAIAVRFFKLDAEDNFKEEEILFVIRALSANPESLRPLEILERICSYSGLLQKTGTAYYFVHRTIWEYYVAVGMKDEPIENLWVRANVPSWEEPIRLYVGLTSERELPKVLGGIWKENKGLALRAMMELPIFPSELLDNLITKLDQPERLRLVFQLKENVDTQASTNELDARRMLLDTLSALLRVRNNCQVVYECTQLLEAYSEILNCTECEELISKVLDLPNATKRRKKYLSENRYKLEFVNIEGGKFVMGKDSPDRTPDEKPEHDVILKNFWIARYLVTNLFYYDAFPFATDHREIRSNRDDQPVIYVTWYEAYIFARWIGCDLPTEAEWEYACRSGGQDDAVLFDYDKINEYGWYVANSDGKTKDVGLLKPNSWGIYDMMGNVREWCKDWFDQNYYKVCLESGVVENPTGPEFGTRKSIKGGCFDWNVANLVPTYRNYNTPDNVYFVNGFRLVYRGTEP